MKPLNFKNRRCLALRPAPERLEGRQVLSAGAGNTIAIMPGAIAEADKTTTIEFTVAPVSFTVPRGSVLLGVDTVAQTGSSVTPVITNVSDSAGARVQHSTYAPKQPVVISGQAITPATVTKVSFSNSKPGVPKAPHKFKVTVGGANKTTGQFLAGYYLVGDVDGNGKVDKADMKLIKAAIGSKADSATYKFDADSNRDGRVDRTDLQLAQRNLGAKTSIMPLISADIDATTADPTTRTSSKPEVTLQGVASAGATIAFTPIGGASTPVSTTVDTTGNYKITVPLVQGSNQFMVTSTDSFGQTISGTIAAITYKPVST